MQKYKQPSSTLDRQVCTISVLYCVNAEFKYNNAANDSRLQVYYELATCRANVVFLGP